jgi:hypothetical protein
MRCEPKNPAPPVTKTRRGWGSDFESFVGMDKVSALLNSFSSLTAFLVTSRLSIGMTPVID